MSILSGVQGAPRDPILGLTEAYNSDSRDEKVNLGVGVYTDENGKVPLLECVRRADDKLAEGHAPWGYLPIDGLRAYDEVVAQLVFGDSVPRERLAVVQALGGTGGLKVAADFLRQLNHDGKVLISDPSWENHRALFTRAGFTVESYPYYDAATRSVDFDGMLGGLRAAAPGTVVVLHACCHNPTGYDLTPEQWDQVLEVVREAQLVPLLDMAYQGFASGIETDGRAVRLFAESGLTTFVTTSFSKTFSLYGERIGALSVVCADADEVKRVLSQLKIVVRTNYSNPPSHGAKVVAMVLENDDLRQLWESELARMRDRIKAMRQGLRDGLQVARPEVDWSYITTQNGMFSYSGLSKESMVRLREEYGVYGLDSGRICVAALNEGNLPHVVGAIAAVTGP
ncbi:aspartate/tyrosine/aromatic aminotransferase [Naumannella sp. ID2617S]|uniref:Aminotransferase n=1 Tax=Enemella dayhoffiae TaxID=2016507 RepID=A0A255HBM3_9ACTN|nr:amino acid aminotransferase [Enemella dayhoffiae]NNG19678.1 aspartate/tyrosine/aromatic aminotransferase [Naumannella sp. ID2617S]OYO24945.1 aromatic amino acid aminotransferase [Enemella dayhoffiae]